MKSPPATSGRRTEWLARMAFGLRVRRLRIAAGLTQVDISHRLGIPQSTVSKIERGQVSIDLERVVELAKALDCRPTALVAHLDRVADIRGADTIDVGQPSSVDWLFGDAA